MLSANGPFRNDGHRFMGCIIHHGQTLDAAAFRRAVKYEVHGPNLVGGLWPAQRLAMGHRNLLPLTPSYLKTGLCVQTLDALVIHGTDELFGEECRVAKAFRLPAAARSNR